VAKILSYKMQNGDHMLTDKQKQKILNTVNKYWRTAGHVWVDDQGFVNVTGLLNPKAQKPPGGKLPVKFGVIKGDLNLKNMGLTTLEGCGSSVSGWLYLEGNPLTTLEHAPSQVRVLMLDHMSELKSLHGCPSDVKIFMLRRAPNLESLEGLPTTPGHMDELVLPYHENLPLLRTLVAHKISIRKQGWGYSTLEPVQPLTDILNDPQWVGKGKSGMLNCAMALKKAGYTGNAAW
jgi:hypothetical protein